MAYDNKPARARPGFSPVEYIAEYIFEAYMVAMFKAKNTYSTSDKYFFYGRVIFYAAAVHSCGV